MDSFVALSHESRPKLPPGIRLRHDRRSGQFVLLAPERGLALNESAAEIIRRCTGALSVEEITAELLRAHGDLPLAELEPQVFQFLQLLIERGLLTVDES